MSSPLSGAVGVLSIDPAFADKAVKACVELSNNLADVRRDRIGRLPSASLRLGALPSSQQLVTAYGRMWDVDADSLDGIVARHIAVADSMREAFTDARRLFEETESANTAAFSGLADLESDGIGDVLLNGVRESSNVAESYGAASVLMNSVREFVAAADAVGSWNLSPRTLGYQSLPVTVSESFALMSHEQIKYGADTIGGDLRSMADFADSWREAGVDLASAAEDAAAGLVFLRSELTGDFAERVVGAVEDYLVSLSTLAVAADEVRTKLLVAGEGLGNAVRSVPEVPVMSEAEWAAASPAVQAAFADKREAEQWRARDVMQLGYRPVVEESAQRVPVLPPPGLPVSASGGSFDAGSRTPSVPNSSPVASGGHGGATSSDGLTGMPGFNSVPGASDFGSPATEPAQMVATRPAMVDVAPHAAATESRSGAEGYRPLGAGGPGSAGSSNPGLAGAAGIVGSGRPAGVPGSRLGSPDGGGSRPSTRAVPGSGLGSTSSSRSAGSSAAGVMRPVMGGFAPMGAGAGAGAGASGQQGHSPARYLTSKPNGRSIVGTLPATVRPVIGASDKHFDV